MANVITGTLPIIAFIVFLVIVGLLLSTWLKIKNGYPVSNFAGVPLHPKTNVDADDRIKLLITENAQLRAELGSIKHRVESLERIATDQPTRLAREIEALAIQKGVAE